MKLSNIREIFSKNADAVAYALLLNMLLFIPLLLSPIFQMVFADYILIDKKNDWLVALIALMAITAVFAGVVNWFQRNCLFRLANKIEASNLNKYMRIMFNSAIRLFTKKDSYTLLSQSEKSEKISELLTDDILSLIFDVFRVIFYFAAMMWIDVTMSVIVVVLIVANVILTKAAGFIRDKFAAKGGGEEEDEDAVERLTAQGERIYSLGMQNIETFKSTATESVLFKRLLGAKTAVINAKRDGDFEEACSPVENLPEVLFLNLLLMISALRIMDRSFSIGTYLEFQMYASAFFYPLSGVLSIRSQLKDFEESLAKFFKELGNNNDEKGVKRKPAGGKRKLDGYVEFKNVTFGYEENAPVIKDFSLTVKPGQRVAVIGKSGAGKTTMLKLLQGLYEPDTGEVTIDGIPASEIDRELFKNSVGSANQEIAIFSASIRENITLWDTSLTDADLYNAATDACIHKYISSLDGAYDYLLSENGNNFSKGQCQRLEIARALIYNPSVALFDEATSSIDQENREHIQKVLKKRGCACIVATHVLSYMAEYDEIIILGKAKVIARGKHGDLIDSSPFYKSMFEAERLAVRI
jgi:ABC-type bacteriocin/lantibiotic exporter with double-glycine peptidase domain